MKSFNQLLIERIQAYFKKEYSLDISDEKAEEYLHTLADMFAVFAEIGRGDPPDALESEAGGTPAEGLDNSLT